MSSILCVILRKIGRKIPRMAGGFEIWLGVLEDSVENGVGGCEIFVLERGAEAEILFAVEFVILASESMGMKAGGRALWRIVDEFVAMEGVGVGARGEGRDWFLHIILLPFLWSLVGSRVSEELCVELFLVRGSEEGFGDLDAGLVG